MNWPVIELDAVRAVLPLLAAAATALVGKAAQYGLYAVAGLRNQQARDALDWALSRAETVVQDVVVALNATEVNTLKATHRWNATAAARVKIHALDTVATSLPAAAREVLGAQQPDLAGWLGVLIEDAVAFAPNHVRADAPPDTPGSTVY